MILQFKFHWISKWNSWISKACPQCWMVPYFPLHGQEKIQKVDLNNFILYYNKSKNPNLQVISNNSVLLDWRFAKKSKRSLSIRISFRRLYLWKPQYIRWFNLNYLIETTHYASLCHQFNSPTSKKHSSPATEFRKILAETTTSKNYRFSKRSALEINILNSIELILNPLLQY